MAGTPFARAGASAGRALPSALRLSTPLASRPSPAARRQRRSVQPQAAAAPAAELVEAVYEATGVPLVDSLLKMKTVEAAAQHSMKLVVIAFAGVILGSLLFKAIDKVTGGKLGDSSGGFNVVASAIASSLKPAQVLLPFYGVAYSTTVVSALVQVTALKMKTEFAQLCRGNADEVLTVIKVVTQLVQDTSELVLIIFAAWAAMDFKNRVLNWLGGLLSKGEENRSFISQLLRPFSVVLNCFILVAAAMATLTAFGINIGPLVASVGGIGLAVGLATQSLAANVVSALSLFSGRPFVVGDQVELSGAGFVAVEGTVVHIEPMRTVFRTAEGDVVYMNNSEVTNCVIKNRSQKDKKDF